MKTAIIYASVHHGNTKKIIDEIAKSMDSVQQLQAMNQMMKGQLNQYEVQSAMILGIAGGNGLEHVDTEKLNKVYGVDINQEYLTITKKRYENLSDTLDCLCIDLVSEAEKLPQVDMLIANLLIEYIGYEKSSDSDKTCICIVYNSGKCG